GSLPPSFEEGFPVGSDLNRNGNAPPRLDCPTPTAEAALPTPEAPRPPLLVESREAARLLCISERTLGDLTHAQEIRVIRIGRGVRYAISELERFVERRMGVE